VRLNAANLFLVAAKASASREPRSLQRAAACYVERWARAVGYGSQHWRVASSTAQLQRSGALLRGWQRRGGSDPLGDPLGALAADSAIASLLTSRFADDPRASAAAVRERVGRLNVSRGARKQLTGSKREALRRSYVLALLVDRGPARVARDALALLRTRGRRLEGSLRCGALVALAVALLSGAVWLPLCVLSMVHSALLPLVCAARSPAAALLLGGRGRSADSAGASALAALLTGANLACVAFAFAVGKRTWAFQRVVRVDLIECTGFPDGVYEHGALVVDEIVRRYRLQRLVLRRDAYVHRMLPSDCARRVASFVERPMQRGPRQEGDGFSWSEAVYARLNAASRHPWKKRVPSSSTAASGTRASRRRSSIEKKTQ
jgi:hypothetical protein